MRTHSIRTALCLTILTAAVARLPAEEIDRHELGRSVKLTVLVDKVMQRHAGWVADEWMIRAAAEAGFNVYSPREGFDRLDEVGRVAQWCKESGIYHLPWMRGSLAAPKGPEADGKRLVWASGNQQPLYSPNSDEFWDWTYRYVLQYARIGARNRHLIGVFLDYENYAPGKEANLYSLSYDDLILGKFAASKGIRLPELPLGERKVWLESQGLHEAFSQFQIAHWRQRCRELREAVDRIEPTFQFCVYPAPGTPLMVEAIYPEWATQAAPLILADASVYGRGGNALSERAALEGNRRKLTERMKVPQAAGISFLYSGGIDPAVRGADPEFSGKNAVMISEVTDGYWIFYEGPTYTEQDHAEYWKWFTWANRAIAAGQFHVQHDPRQSPEGWLRDLLDERQEGIKLVPPPATGPAAKLPPVRLRRGNLLLLACRAGKAVEVILSDQPIAQYENSLEWDLRGPALARVDSGVIAHGETGRIAFTPESDGVHLLAVSAGNCAYSVVECNVPLGLYAGGWLHLIRGARRLYFRVPDGLREFSLAAKGAGQETVRVNVYDSHGQPVASAQTTLAEELVELAVPAAGRPAGVWSLELAKADEGALEDASIKLGSGLPPVLALVPEHAFAAGK